MTERDVVSLYVSQTETLCFPNRNNLFPLMKQNVSLNEISKKHSIYQLVNLELSLKTSIFNMNDV